eukprot:3703758-Pyramimonas_sp.AAC.1
MSGAHVRVVECSRAAAISWRALDEQGLLPGPDRHFVFCRRHPRGSPDPGRAGTFHAQSRTFSYGL